MRCCHAQTDQTFLPTHRRTDQIVCSQSWQVLERVGGVVCGGKRKRWRKKLRYEKAYTCLEFLFVNGARVVFVVVPERGLPVVHVLPQSSKLLKVDGAGAIPVEHPNH